MNSIFSFIYASVETFRLDSLQMKDLHDQLALLLTSEDYNQIPSLDFGVVAMFSAVIGFVSMFYGWKAYKSQVETQKNTNNVGAEEVRNMLIDMVRHFYRNMVVLFAVEEKMKKYKDSRGYYTAYPSEEHFLKLKPDFTWLSLVNNKELMQMVEVLQPQPVEKPAVKGEEAKEEDKKAKEETKKAKEETKKVKKDPVTALAEEAPMSVFNLAVLLRNFCTEVDVYCQHSKTIDLRSKVKDEDLQTLQMKCGFLARQCVRVLNSLCPVNGQSVTYSIEQYRAEVQANLKTVHDYVAKHTNYNGTGGDKDADKKVTIQVDPKRLGFFADGLFEGEPAFVKMFCKDVQKECGQGDNGLPKIRIIEF